ncbi:MAG TPA: DUF3014 domain-containing protein [Rhodanobacteraceae bacterium]|nr:DUF3014 domain-containing protein [Rhodanobacteraceae bacterium]
MSARGAKAGWAVSGVLAALIVAGVVYVRRHTPQPEGGAQAVSQAAPPLVLAPAAPATAPVAIAGTVAPAVVLPAALLHGDSGDDSVRAALSALAGGQSLDGLLVPAYLIQRIVATIDALPQHDVQANVLPVRRPAGSLVIARQGEAVRIDAGNADRYAPYMQILAAADPAQLVAWYGRHYDWFEQAYRQLGYPDGDFNARLLSVIDHLLATPEPASPPLLVRPKVLYEFRDPALEALSAGQKMLLRVGLADEQRVKAKLRAIRAELRRHPPTQTAAPDAAA